MCKGLDYIWYIPHYNTHRPHYNSHITTVRIKNVSYLILSLTTANTLHYTTVTTHIPYYNTETILQHTDLLQNTHISLYNTHIIIQQKDLTTTQRPIITTHRLYYNTQTLLQHRNLTTTQRPNYNTQTNKPTLHKDFAHVSTVDVQHQIYLHSITLNISPTGLLLVYYYPTGLLLVYYHPDSSTPLLP